MAQVTGLDLSSNKVPFRKSTYMHVMPNASQVHPSLPRNDIQSWKQASVMAVRFWWLIECRSRNKTVRIGSGRIERVRWNRTKLRSLIYPRFGGIEREYKSKAMRPVNVPKLRLLLEIKKHAVVYVKSCPCTGSKRRNDVNHVRMGIVTWDRWLHAVMLVESRITVEMLRFQEIEQVM